MHMSFSISGSYSCVFNSIKLVGQCRAVIVVYLIDTRLRVYCTY